MKKTIAEIIVINDVLTYKMTLDLHVEVSWELSDILDATQKHVKKYNEARTKLIQKYGELNDGGKPSIGPGNKNREQFLTDLLSIEKKTVDFPDYKFKRSDIKSEAIRGDALRVLKFMIATKK